MVLIVAGLFGCWLDLCFVAWLYMTVALGFDVVTFGGLVLLGCVGLVWLWLPCACLLADVVWWFVCYLGLVSFTWGVLGVWAALASLSYV